MTPATRASTARSRSGESGRATDDGNHAGAPWRERVLSRSLERARQRSLERGQTFIDAALDLIRDADIDDFTLQQVADRANQSLRTFYQHFASKDDLLLAVFEEEVRAHAQSLRGAVDRYSDPLERIAAFVVAGAEAKDSRGVGSTLARYRLRLSESHPEEVAAIQRPVVSLVQDLLRDAVHAGAIEPLDVAHHAYILATLKTAYLTSRILGNELGVGMPTSTELARFCLEGLGAQLPASFASR